MPNLRSPRSSRRLPDLVRLVGALILSTTLVAACGSASANKPGDSAPAASSPAATDGGIHLPWDSPTPAPTPEPVTPIVPVGDFRTSVTGVSAADVTGTLAGTSKTYTALEVVDADATAILAALGVDAATADPTGVRLVRAASADALAADLAKNRDRLGFLRASDVGPSVTALAWDGKSLFGVDRVKTTAEWQLNAKLGPEAATGSGAFDASKTWTIVAGGDVILDRGVYKQEVVLKKGADFAFDGGTATITGRTCCSSMGWKLPKTQRTGNAGLVRHYLTGADLSMVNLEGPAPNTFTYHTQGTSFSFSQALLAGLVNAGIDQVSLANNHIGDTGKAGILQTIAALEKAGIGYSGAGANAAAAHKAGLYSVNGITVGVLGYDMIAPRYAATATGAGNAQMSAAGIKADIAAARADGAQIVIVYPHWGTEYQAAPNATQKNWGHALIDAGADMVIGNHPHWVEGMEVYKGKPIWYALGNFVFDQVWSEQTEEGLMLELTFDGTTLVQARAHPLVLLDSAQPNLLQGSGAQDVLNQMWTASKGLLPW